MATQLLALLAASSTRAEAPAPNAPPEHLTAFAVGDWKTKGPARVYSATYTDAFGFRVPVVSFVREPGQPPRVRVTQLQRRESKPTGAVLQAEISADVWNEVLTRGRFFDRVMAPLPNDIARCSDAGTSTVELAEPGAEPRQRSDSSCSGDIVSDYARFLARRAVELLPNCATAGSVEQPFYALESCFLLSGDRAAAAEVLRAYGRATFRFPSLEEVQRGGVSGFSFDYQAGRLSWFGEQAVGWAAARELFGAKNGDRAPFMSVSGVIGRDERHVQLTGRIRIVENGVAGMASMEQAWVRMGPQGDWTVSAWVVSGPFAPFPPRPSAPRSSSIAPEHEAQRR